MSKSADPFLDRVDRATGDYPDNWPRPEPGDYIVGEVTGIEMSAGKYEQPVLQILCEEKNTEYSVWLPQYVRDVLTHEDVRLGHRVAVKYYGLKKSKGGREYQHYSVHVDRSREPIVHEPERNEDITDGLVLVELPEPISDDLPF